MVEGLGFGCGNFSVISLRSSGCTPEELYRDAVEIYPR